MAGKMLGDGGRDLSVFLPQAQYRCGVPKHTVSTIPDNLEVYERQGRMQEPAVFRKRNRQVRRRRPDARLWSAQRPRQMPVMRRTYEDDRNHKYVL